MYKNSQKKGKKPSQAKQSLTSRLERDLSNKSYNYGKISKAIFKGVGFPDQLKCTLKYKETGISFSGATPAAQVYRVNSLFDPNLTGIGHQPNYFDQLTAVYGQYLVTAAKVSARIINENNSSGTMARCVGVYADSNTSSQTVENLCESRFAKESYCGSFNSGPAITNLQMPAIDIGVIQGEDRKGLNFDPQNYQGVGINPVDPVFFIFKCGSADGLTSLAVTVDFEIYFECLFKELAPIGESLIHKRLSTSDSRKPCSNVDNCQNSNGVCRCPDREIRKLYSACCNKCHLSD
jgi:hypothetical protein